MEKRENRSSEKESRKEFAGKRTTDICRTLNDIAAISDTCT